MSSLWIEFAKAALTGILAHHGMGDQSRVDIAQFACSQADAMMAAIEKRGVAE